MSLWGALLLAIVLLMAPWLLMPPGGHKEARGFLRAYWWFNALYCALWHRLDLKRTDPLPETGPAILISNHTCCIDHMILQASTWRVLGFLILKDLYDFWLFNWFCRLACCIPVRRDGKDVSATRGALRALDQGRVVPIFPEGRIYPTSGRELGEGKPGVAYIALRAGVPVIPAYIWGTPETNKVVRSYFTPSHAGVVFGPPIDLSDLRKSGKAERDQLDEATERLMGAIRVLRDMIQGVASDGSSGSPHVQGAAGEAQSDGQGANGDPGALSGGCPAVIRA
jgi:1-acyl-sn-glycerol-3-phosphate acyltransferase